MTQRQPILIVLIALLSAACSPRSRPTSYDDCILETLKPGHTEVAAKAIIAACVDKFYPKYDWDELAKKVGHKRWAEIVDDAEYASLTAEEKKEVKKAYWARVLEPQIRTEFRGRAGEEFMLFKLAPEQ